MGSETGEIIDELFESFFEKYQKGEESMRGSKFVRNSIGLFYYHLQRINLKRGGSYVDSPKRLKNKKSSSKSKK